MAGINNSAEEKYVIYQKLIELCIEKFEDKAQKGDAIQILTDLMDEEYISMHNPYHHFIVAACLLTASCIVNNNTKEELKDLLDKARIRADYISGGFCAAYGACGAGIGTGIFISVYTDTTTMSEESWQWGNEMTGLALQSVSQVPGPRCCKRTSYLAVIAAIRYISKKLSITLTEPEQIICKYYHKNLECKKKLCPFYQEEE